MRGDGGVAGEGRVVGVPKFQCIARVTYGTSVLSVDLRLLGC